MKKLLILVMACYGLNARSQQTNEGRNFVHLYSDSVIYASRIKLRPDISGSWSLQADGKRIPLQQVKFFNSNDGYFANLRKTNVFNYSSIGERILEGKINLYQEVFFEPIPFEADYRFGALRARPSYGRVYYNKGEADVKKVNYTNLSMDMADRPQSLDLLKGYRRKQQAGIMMYVAAGASAILGVVTLLSNNDSQATSGGFGDVNRRMIQSKGRGIILFSAGGGLALGGLLIQSSGSRNIEQAIDLYNR